MAIPLANPTTINATYDEIWLSDFRISAPYPNGPVRVSAVIDEARTVNAQTGEKELRGLPGQHRMDIMNFFNVATPAELQVMGAVLLAVKARMGI